MPKAQAYNLVTNKASLTNLDSGEDIKLASRSTELLEFVRNPSEEFSIFYQ